MHFNNMALYAIFCVRQSHYVDRYHVASMQFFSIEKHAAEMEVSVSRRTVTQHTHHVKRPVVCRVSKGSSRIYITVVSERASHPAISYSGDNNRTVRDLIISNFQEPVRDSTVTEQSETRAPVLIPRPTNQSFSGFEECIGNWQRGWLKITTRLTQIQL